MGLTIISADDQKYLFSASYSTFLKFRRKIAKLMGLNPDLIYPQIKTSHSYDLVKAQSNWKEGMAVFFYHSDCEGLWNVDDCKKILKLLRKVNSYNFKLMNMIDGLEYCVEKKQSAIFC